MNMEFIASYWPACLLACCLLVGLLLSYFLFLYSAGRDGDGQPEIHPFAKNASSIAQKCSETQISFARAQPSRQERGIDRPKL